MIRFGWFSMLLLIGAAEGGLVAALLASRRRNRTANALLATIIFAYVLHITPFIIGYAGFYDAYPWLSFAPFSITLAYGPLIYLYVTRVTLGHLDRRWCLHVLPAALQFAYLSIVFVQPLPSKNAWDVRIHEPWIVPLETIATYLSLFGYTSAAVVRYDRYRRWLRETTTDPHDAQLGWLRSFLVLFGITLVLNVGFDGVNYVIHRLSYFAYFPLYLWYAALVFYLGLEGWKNESHAMPSGVMQKPEKRSEAPIDAGLEATWWCASMQKGGYFRDPDLTLAKLAVALGASQARITRAVNDGLGQNFSEAVNHLRVRDVVRRLEDPLEQRDLLELALASGFSSKQTFNRCFRRIVGTTPSAYRRSVRRDTTSQVALDA